MCLLLTGKLPVSDFEKKIFFKNKKKDALTGRLPVSNHDFQKVFLSLTGNLPVSNMKC